MLLYQLEELRQVGTVDKSVVHVDGQRHQQAALAKSVKRVQKSRIGVIFPSARRAIFASDIKTD